ncbi:MAG: hypothetical protein ISQ06_00800 [Planctomycetaceae bacterium]|nr:hypothetical protein [Planctomycetaceae bacterium]
MSYYIRDNFFEDWGYQGHPRQWKRGGHDRAPKWVQFNNNGLELDAPAKTPEIELVNAKVAYQLVLDKAGCWPRDRVNKRTVHKVKTKTGVWGRNAPLVPTDGWFLKGLTQNDALQDTDGAGLPDVWEQSHNLDFRNPHDAASVVATGESGNERHLGYSYIEFYVNELADNLVP